MSSIDCDQIFDKNKTQFPLLTIITARSNSVFFVLFSVIFSPKQTCYLSKTKQNNTDKSWYKIIWHNFEKGDKKSKTIAFLFWTKNLLLFVAISKLIQKHLISELLYQKKNENDELLKLIVQKKRS